MLNYGALIYVLRLMLVRCFTSAVAGLPMAARPAVDDFVSKTVLKLDGISAGNSDFGRLTLICRIYV